MRISRSAPPTPVRRPPSAPTTRVMSLQRHAGNRAVSRLVAQRDASRLASLTVTSRGVDADGQTVTIDPGPHGIGDVTKVVVSTREGGMQEIAGWEIGKDGSKLVLHVDVRDAFAEVTRLDVYHKGEGVQRPEPGGAGELDESGSDGGPSGGTGAESSSAAEGGAVRDEAAGEAASAEGAEGKSKVAELAEEIAGGRGQWEEARRLFLKTLDEHPKLQSRVLNSKAWTKDFEARAARKGTTDAQLGAMAGELMGITSRLGSFSSGEDVVNALAAAAARI